MVWNYSQSVNAAGSWTIKPKNLNAVRALVWRLDVDHGKVLLEDAKLGAPRYPTPAQVQQLRRAAELPPPTSIP